MMLRGGICAAAALLRGAVCRVKISPPLLSLLLNCLAAMAKSYLKYEQELTFGIVSSCNNVKVRANQHLHTSQHQDLLILLCSGMRSSRLLSLQQAND
jgi:hypothetical protein